MEKKMELCYVESRLEQVNITGSYKNNSKIHLYK